MRKMGSVRMGRPSNLRQMIHGVASSLRALVVSMSCAVLVSAWSISGLAQQNTASGATESAPVRPDRRVVVRFLTEGDYPPFNYYDDEGVLTGFNVDLARALCLEVNAACDIQARNWDELLPAIARSEADAAIAGHLVTARALRTVDFTDRYFHTPARFAAKRTGAKLEITPDGLDGRRIGVARGSVHEAYLTAFFQLSSIQVFDTPELARDALMIGKIDLLFDDGISLVFWINGTASKECCELRGGPFLEPRFFGDGMAIAVPKIDQELKLLLNGALKRVRASGRFEELVQQYFRTRLY